MTLVPIFLGDLYNHLFSLCGLNIYGVFGKDFQKKASSLITTELLPWFDNELNQRLESLSDYEKKKFLIHLSAQLDTPVPGLSRPFGDVYTTCWESFTKHSSKFKAIVDLALEGINSTKEPIAKSAKPTAAKGFEDLGNAKTRDYILELLEYLMITKGKVYILGPRKKGAILGVVLALKEGSIIPAWNKEILTKIVGSRIGLHIGSKLGKSYIADEYHERAKHYIKTHARP